MMRLLGVLVGSALAVGALVVFVGIPEFTTEETVAASTIITLPMRPTGPPELPADDVTELQAQTTTEPPESAGENPAPAPPAEAGTGPVTVADVDGDAADLPSQLPRPTEPPDDTTVDLSPEGEPRQWYAFWSPFRSEIAAAGFVDQLQSVTGLDYRIVKVKTGVYEVAFAYADDDEITNNLSQITAATGLQMPEH
jgi:hypothetical protein